MQLDCESSTILKTTMTELFYGGRRGGGGGVVGGGSGTSFLLPYQG